MSSTQTKPDIPIIFEDNHLLVVNKPSGLLSQEDHTGDPDILSLCRQYLAQSTSKNSPYLGLLHRLDRPVGGLMVLAKQHEAASQLSRQSRDRLMQKTYWAICSGSPAANGLLNDYLCKDHSQNMVHVVSGKNQQAKNAFLSYTTLEKSGSLNLLEVHLQTGRPHQIRVQLAHHGFPIWGDYKYGTNQPDGRVMALRSVKLSFNHPASGDEIHFESFPQPHEPWHLFDRVTAQLS